MFVFRFGYLEMAKYLVEQKPELINDQDKYGRSPLMHKCIYGRLEMVKYLVEECDVDVFVEDNRGGRALGYTYKEEIREYLLEVEEFAMMKKHP